MTFFSFRTVVLGAAPLIAAVSVFAAPPLPSPLDNAAYKSAVLPSLVSAPALPPLTKGRPGPFRIIALPPKFEANAINNKGEVVGIWDAGQKVIEHLPLSVTQAAVWSHSRLFTFAYWDEQPLCRGVAISDTSWAGGSIGLALSDPITNQFDAALWKLPQNPKNHFPQEKAVGHLVNFSNAALTGVNSRRQAVGWCSGGGWFEETLETYGNEEHGSVGFFWQNGKMFPLGRGTAAFGINERGQVVGSWHGRIALWQGETQRVWDEGRGLGINNRGAIVGEKYLSQKTEDTKRRAVLRHAFLCDNGTVKDLGVLRGDAESCAISINDRGQIVGSSALVLESLDARAFLWQAGKMHDLNILIPKDSGWILREARSINNKGQIVGTGTFHGTERSFLLTPR